MADNKTTEDSAAADVVKKLPPAARRAVLWLHADGRQRLADYTLRGTPAPRSLASIVDAGLATMHESFGYPRGKFFTITGAGQRLCKELEKSANGI